MRIKNFESLATSELRKQCLRILESGLDAIDTEKVTEKQIAYDAKKDILYVMGQEFLLSKFKHVVVVGAGKIAAIAAKVVEHKLGQRLSGGLVIDIVPVNFSILESRVGTHPLPSSANTQATDEIIAMVEKLTEEDLVIAIIGGGGSSLLCGPKTVTLEEERNIIQALMDAGSSISEMNTVRKHLSKVKGGGLAKLAYPATVVGLIFSDVPGNTLSEVASGPTVLDNTTMHDAMAVLNKYNILDRCKMDHCGLTETPKEDIYFKNVHNFLFCSSLTALKAMQDKASDLGLKPKIWQSAFSGEASEIAKEITSTIQPGQCWLAGGESVVTIKPNSFKGSGGRNQELALAALISLPEDTVFATLASDGRDNSDVAGAIVDATTTQKAKSLGINIKEALVRHDEYNIVLDLNSAIMTGITGSNVSDLIVCIRN